MLVINRGLALLQIPRHLFEVGRGNGEFLAVADELAGVRHRDPHQAVFDFAEIRPWSVVCSPRLVILSGAKNPSPPRAPHSELRTFFTHLDSKLLRRSLDLRDHRALRPRRQVGLTVARQGVPDVRGVVDGQFPFARIRAFRRVSEIASMDPGSADGCIIPLYHIRLRNS
ncbi:MAG: hypothetical protein DMG22_15295 [Acidobacteria bacterium]|nr:MAG: hypothetical protein DMG22_15295 [Acidobacteriota bacterium]